MQRIFGNSTPTEANFDVFRSEYLHRFDGNEEECSRAFNYLRVVLLQSNSGPCRKAVEEYLKELRVRTPANAMRIFDLKIAAINGKMVYFPECQVREDKTEVFHKISDHKYSEAAGLVSLYRSDLRPEEIEPLITRLMEYAICKICDGLFTEGWPGFK